MLALVFMELNTELIGSYWFAAAEEYLLQNELGMWFSYFL